MKVNRKVAPVRQCALENLGCYIDGPWPVHHLRHRERDPLCVAIVRDTLIDMVLGGYLKATEDAICSYNRMKGPSGVDEP